VRTLTAAGGSPDTALLYAINGISRHLPGFLDSFLGFCGEYGVPLASVVVVGLAWWQARRRAGAAVAVAGVAWALIGAVFALMLNVPVRALVDRPRPFVAHPGRLHLLMDHSANGSFASDHATFTMAVAVGLLLVNRRYGMVAGALALVEGFLRVFMGVHYPSDIVGGYALAAATVLLLGPLAMALLVPLAHYVSRGPAGSVIRAAGAGGAPVRSAAPSRRGGRGRRGGRPAAPIPGSGPEPGPDEHLAA